MSRKNIFEIVADIFDISMELDRMYRLFEKRGTVHHEFQVFALRDYINKVGFSSWRNRGRCVDLNDFLALLDFEDL